MLSSRRRSRPTLVSRVFRLRSRTPLDPICLARSRPTLLWPRTSCTLEFKLWISDHDGIKDDTNYYEVKMDWDFNFNRDDIMIFFGLFLCVCEILWDGLVENSLVFKI
jgi:hypothetical protein